MAINETPWVLEAGAYAAEPFRRQLQMMLNGTGITSNVGGGANTGLFVTQPSTSVLAVSIAAGQAFIPCTAGSSSAGMAANLNAQTAYGLPSSFTQGGVYYAWNNAAYTVNLASQTSYARTDLIVLEVNDAQYSGSTNNGTIASVTGGSGGGAPNAPANSLVLASIAVPASSGGTTLTITDQRPFARMLGGPSLQVLGLTSGALVGGTPPLAQAVMYLQAGTSATTTSGSGVYTIPFPTSFPNGVMSVLAKPLFGGGVQPWVMEETSWATNQFVGTLVNTETAGPVASQFFSYEFVAVGF